MKPSIPQGTRDFNATTLRKRYFIFETIRSVFELYGFEPLETPAFENIETLMGKYGEEGDKLIFKILNNGLDNPTKKEKVENAFQGLLEGKSFKEITERALRYDLTIPFARYVAMNAGQLVLPYKRYQMQPVWRADRPQRGRYREFYQCDADVVGSYSLLNDAELANIYSEVFSRLRIPVDIKINSRKILAALSEKIGGADKMMDITMAIDKLDKIGIEKVKEELLNRGLSDNQVEQISQYIKLGGSNEDILKTAREFLQGIKDAEKGLDELTYILKLTKSTSVSIDLNLARGLNYYTGVIYEVKAKGVQIGSIGGGGRYDDLTGLFGVKNIAGVGISFGVDRIYDVMEDLSLFPENVHKGTRVLFTNMGETEIIQSMSAAALLRNQGIACELFHENTKLDKQLKYADKKQIPFVIIMGETEITAGNCIIKNMKSGSQEIISLNELGNYFINKDI